MTVLKNYIHIWIYMIKYNLFLFVEKGYPGPELKRQKKVQLMMTEEEEEEETRKNLKPLIASKISGYHDIYLPLEVEEKKMFNCSDCVKSSLMLPIATKMLSALPS